LRDDSEVILNADPSGGTELQDGKPQILRNADRRHTPRSGQNVFASTGRPSARLPRRRCVSGSIVSLIAWTELSQKAMLKEFACALPNLM
jgi:hypothetical protein